MCIKRDKLFIDSLSGGFGELEHVEWSAGKGPGQADYDQSKQPMDQASGLVLCKVL